MLMPTMIDNTLVQGSTNESITELILNWLSTVEANACFGLNTNTTNLFEQQLRQHILGLCKVAKVQQRKFLDLEAFYGFVL